MPSGYPDSRWALTPPFHPYLCLPCGGPSAVSFCCTVCPGFSRFPSLTFVRRVALWCPDFPHPPLARKLRPSGERRAHHGRDPAIFQTKTEPSFQSLLTGKADKSIHPPREMADIAKLFVSEVWSFATKLPLRPCHSSVSAFRIHSSLCRNLSFVMELDRSQIRSAEDAVVPDRRWRPRF